ncbi:MAG: TIGR04076 family protein [Chloroflexi bacterium]|nr:TIGR04076 family protein [Chloroflexota bacterium]
MKPPKRHKVKITVKEVTKGNCPLEMKPGDSWVYHRTVPEGICLAAFSTLIPAIRTFGAPGGKFSWPDGEEEKTESVRLSCPDPRHWVIYEVSRLR